MSRDKHSASAPAVTRRKKDTIDPYTAKIRKSKSKQRREQDLKHAVTHRDLDALEDYEEVDYDFADGL